jgi:shikimate dehydrogenase
VQGNPAVVDRYGIIGYPVSHSRSPVIHRLFALQTNQNLQYELIEVAPGKLDTVVRQFQRTGGKGLNITLPYKSEVIDLVDHLSERAQNAGAINTLIFRKNEIFGDNTDGIGLMRDLLVNLGLKLADVNILILGAGGATRGIVGPLLDAKPKSITIANRTMSKARVLAEHFSTSGPVNACQFREVRPSSSYDLVINATSAGVKGEVPSYPESAITDRTFCYDLSYGINPTPFCDWAVKKGATRSVMGWGMLVEQAAESFHLWRGIMPDTRSVLKQIAVTA